jgi:hypothetical protein
MDSNLDMASYNFIKIYNSQHYKKFIKEIFILINHMERGFCKYIKME